jgi:anti-anti-sigma regulatory factor
VAASGERQVRGRPRAGCADAPVLRLGAALTPAEMASLHRRLGTLLDERPDAVVCDAAALTAPDLATVDALLRLVLAARRGGAQVRVCRPPPPLAELLLLVGLPALLPPCRCGHGPTGGDVGSGVEVRGQVEQREQAGGVEEGVQAHDPPVADLHDLERPGREAAGGIRPVLAERGRPARDGGHQP